MLKRHQRQDYQTIRRSKRMLTPKHERLISKVSRGGANPRNVGGTGSQMPFRRAASTLLKRGHIFSYLALLLFTLILYARPAEFYPSPLTASIALIAGVITLILFVPTQLSLEGSLTARPPEVNFVLLFCLTGLLSIPLAINPAQAWHEFGD